MKTFRINKNLSIICEWKNTRNGFKHEATLLQNNCEVGFAKCCYLNRTWESFEFKSVIKNLLSACDILSKQQKSYFLNKVKGTHKKAIKKEFQSIAMVAQIGDLLCNDQKEKNDWKKRMIKAGLENKGLQIPENWDILSEDEKTKRLDNVINCLNE